MSLSTSPNLPAIKTLLMVRHAKSSWDSDVSSDFERTLNERGKRDAPEMARRLKDLHLPIDAFISSPAKRAKKTATYFAEAYGVEATDLVLIPELYHASSDTFFEVLQQLGDQHQNVAIFSHNPGITEFVNLLTPKVRIDNMPTCGVFAVKVHTNSWKDFMDAPKEFFFFDYPKSGD